MSNSIVSYTNYLQHKDGVSYYLSLISKIKMLSPQEELVLATDLINNNSKDAANKLLISHLPLVVKLAYSYKGYGLPISDLISEGNIGLMKAITKFDPTKGFRLSTYAMFWIKAYITNFILESWSLVKQGSVLARKKLFFSLAKIKNNLGIINLTNDNIKQISKQTNVNQQDIIMVNNMITRRDISFNAPLANDSENETTLEDLIADQKDNPEEIYSKNEEKSRAKELVKKVFNNLSNREQYILLNRHAAENPLSLEELSKKLNISRERVRQIEKVALEKSRKLLVSI